MSNPTSRPARTLAAIQPALAAEYAAIFGLGVCGPRLSTADQARARRDIEAHAGQVTAATRLLLAHDLRPVPPAADYPAGYPGPGRSGPPRTLLDAEQACCAAWHAVYASAVDAATVAAPTHAENAEYAQIRALAQQGLTAAAVRAVHWRRQLVPARPSVAFPGM